jgi:hypothetical protein
VCALDGKTETPYDLRLRFKCMSSLYVSIGETRNFLHIISGVEYALKKIF